MVQRRPCFCIGQISSENGHTAKSNLQIQENPTKLLMSLFAEVGGKSKNSSGTKKDQN